MIAAKVDMDLRIRDAGLGGQGIAVASLFRQAARCCGRRPDAIANVTRIPRDFRRKNTGELRDIEAISAWVIELRMTISGSVPSWATFPIW
jgi:hypothetical protein